MKIISIYLILRNNAIQDLKDFNSQSSGTQAKKGEQLESMMPSTEIF